MRLFILKFAANLTHHFHCGGGAVVIAESREAAESVLASARVAYVRAYEKERWYDEDDPVPAPRLPPLAITDACILAELPTDATEAGGYIFPNKGCC